VAPELITKSWRRLQNYLMRARAVQLIDLQTAVVLTCSGSLLD
jgi:hypothetical protein